MNVYTYMLFEYTPVSYSKSLMVIGICVNWCFLRHIWDLKSNGDELVKGDGGVKRNIKSSLWAYPMEEVYGENQIHDTM
jgi:hypothetical protein